jgi:hypothetical protein
MSDSDLATGVQVTGGVFGNEGVQDEVQAEREEQRKEALKLLPSVDVIKETIAKRKAEVCDFHTYMTSLKEPTDGEVQIEFRARQLHLDFLTQLEADISNRLSNFEEQTK